MCIYVSLSLFSLYIFLYGEQTYICGEYMIANLLIAMSDMDMVLRTTMSDCIRDCHVGHTNGTRAQHRALHVSKVHWLWEGIWLASYKLLRGIWKVSLIEEAYERHLRGITYLTEVYEKHISLRRHLRGISEAYLIGETSERHFQGFSEACRRGLNVAT